MQRRGAAPERPGCKPAAGSGGTLKRPSPTRPPNLGQAFGDSVIPIPVPNPIALARVEKQSPLRTLPRAADGQSLVEFALAVSLLMLVVTGIMAFGIAFNNYIMLTEATTVGARLVTASRGQTLDPCQTFSGAVYAAAPMLQQASMTFTLSLNGNAYTGTTCSGTATSGAPSNMILGTNAVVTVTYPYSLNLYRLKIVPDGSLLTAQMTELMQ